MPSKEDYERRLNELLGTNIAFSKLSKDELATLLTLLSSKEVVKERIPERRFVTALARFSRDLGFEGPGTRFLEELAGIRQKRRRK